MGYDGYVKFIFFIYIFYDGDIIFIILIGEIEVDIILVGLLVVEVVEKSIINVVKKVDSVENIMVYKDIVKKWEIWWN